MLQLQGERSHEQASENVEGDPQPHILAIDRALACHLLQIVYDASPLVRAETALALTRLALGHNVLFQVKFFESGLAQNLADDFHHGVEHDLSYKGLKVYSGCLSGRLMLAKEDY